MGLLGKVQTFFATTGTSNTSSRVVVDAGALAAGRGRGRPRPGDQIATLKRLAEFSRKEGIDVTAVFEGRRLREISEDDRYAGIPVLFVNGEGTLEDTLLQTARQQGGALIVTGTTELREKMMAAGFDCLQATTLRKAIDSALGVGPRGGGGGSGGGSGSSSSRGGSRGGGRRRGGSRQKRQEGGESGAGGDGDSGDDGGGGGRGRGSRSGGRSGRGRKSSEGDNEDSHLLELIDPL